LKNTTVDISGNTSVIVTIPWKQPMPMLEVGADIGAVPPVYNGIIYVYLLNPITSNGSTDPLVYNLYVSSRNMRFAVPNITYLGSGVPVTQLLSHDVIKADDCCTDGFCPQNRIAFGESTNFSDLEMRVFGDLPRTLKDITSRMLPSFNGTSASVTGNLASFVNVPTVPNFPASVTNSTNPTVTFMNYFAPAFLGARGSKRISVSWGESGQTTSIENFAPSDFVQSYDSTAVPYNSGQLTTRSVGLPSYATTFVNCNVASRVDVVTPMLWPMNFYPTRVVWGSIPCAKFFHNFKYSSAALSFDIFEGTGDDFTFDWFLGFPPLTAP